MPMKLSVGATRKVSDNKFGSHGASVNLELEVDASLISDPGKLRQRIRQLFQMARTALAEELNDQAASSQDGFSPESDPGTLRPASQAQIKAIYGIARSRGLDLSQLLHERFKVRQPASLNIKEASRLIDELKGPSSSSAS
jgi:hypothetical protein